ncbi:MAG: hypothetical protein HYX46_12450 [Betaproteobacteria bacterium]|nr:hypothetical protein [Betaproteobacteria bacterium]
MKVSKRVAIALTVPAIGLAGCYAVPVVTPEGHASWYVYPPGVPPTAIPPGGPYPQGATGAPMPATLPARLYPANDVATQTGVIHGTVTNMMTGKGRFLLNYQGETLSGEATRVDGDSRRGVASAYSPNGAYMSCEYQMNTPRQGAGNCTFSNGARYQVHIGG